ncbi:hypothetical protein WA538_000352 [Blastocystis sp. DL]
MSNPAVSMKSDSWSHSLKELVNSEDITVEQYFQAVATSPVSNSTVDVVLYLYCLLRDNLLSLSSRLRCLLILAYLARNDADYGVYIFELIGEIYDNSHVACERVLCSWILAGSLSQLHSVHLSDLPSLNDATVFDPITLSPDTPSLSLSPSIPTFLFADSYPLHDVDIESGAQVNRCFAVPRFDRPLLPLAPSSLDMAIASPLQPSLSLLLFPQQRNGLETTKRLFLHATETSLSDAEMSSLLSDRAFHDAMQSVAREGVSPEQVSQLIAKNPLVAVEFVREFVRMEKEGILTCDEEEGKWLKPAGTSPGGAPKKAGILSQLWRETPSVSLCHVIGAFLRSGDVSREFFEAAAAALAGKLAGIAGEGVRRHVAQCFCFLVAGMWREGLVEEKRLREAVKRAREAAPGIAEADCVEALMNGELVVK